MSAGNRFHPFVVCAGPHQRQSPALEHRPATDQRQIATVLKSTCSRLTSRARTAYALTQRWKHRAELKLKLALRQVRPNDNRPQVSTTWTPVHGASCCLAGAVRRGRRRAAALEAKRSPAPASASQRIGLESLYIDPSKLAIGCAQLEPVWPVRRLL